MSAPTLVPGGRRREKIDELAARAGALSAGAGGESLFRSAVRRLRRDPVAIIGAVIVVVFLVVAILAPFLAPRDPYAQTLLSEVRQGSIPGAREGFPLGVDQLGRDVLSRLIVGSRQSLVIGVVSTVLGAAVGMVLGILAGGLGGKVDTIVMRFVDILLSIPGLLMAISVSVLLGANQLSLMIAIAVTQVPVFARLLRGSMLVQRDSDYALAARALGVKRRKIVLGHVLPNSLSPVIVQATLSLATAIIEAAALSFLGLGDPDISRPEWGAMLASAQAVLSVRPELAVYPALCIIVVALGFTLLGESLREALDPKFRR
ncbi:ABC transporter permease [Geodermatophilus sp. Leaf369]|jgi:peptide/nickel transport system permease protein|uniref:ABC transporter permease n=1 Tax=Geodermatophilus sp. Leaf369 TaxID=1736354 RepID=UPI0006F7A255|nr:ABC transporter permease [Geodermatophilus sp. Leaf369]KQS60618.1 ABC transporter permease [Geodermatophilus sp. Leaf369]QNG37299.1 ABC transporter permease [Geodermatophilaceae bacterium NBWT11]